jgi:hypothetical protein
VFIARGCIHASRNSCFLAMQSNVVSPDLVNSTISKVDPNEPAGLTLDSAALIWLRNQSNLMPVVAALQKNKVCNTHRSAGQIGR